jgi:hypothetical protein
MGKFCPNWTGGHVLRATGWPKALGVAKSAKTILLAVLLFVTFASGGLPLPAFPP